MSHLHPIYVTALRVGVLGLLCTRAVSLPAQESTIEQCTREAQRTQRINLSAGVYTERAVASAPLEITIAAGNDEARYQGCLQRQGLDPSGESVAYVERLRAAARRLTNRAPLSMTARYD